MSHEHYFIDVSHIDRLDVYRLLDLFKVTCPVAQHILKKALAAGQRGHKDTRRDWQDIADSAARRLQMIDEDLRVAKQACCVPGEQSPCTCPSGDGSLRWPCPAHQARDPRTVAGVDVAFETEKHMNFAPEQEECEHDFSVTGLTGSMDKPSYFHVCSKCGFKEAASA